MLPGRVAATLDRHLRDLWQRFAVPTLGRGQVADDEHLRMPREGQIGLHRNGTAPAFFARDQPGHRVGPHAGRPYHGAGRHRGAIVEVTLSAVTPVSWA